VKQVSTNMIPRTKLLDLATANIQMRMNEFKNLHQDVFYGEEYGVDYNVAGRAFFRLPSTDEYFIFNVGSYRVDPRVSPTERADFLVKYNPIEARIKDIFVLTVEDN